MNLIYFKQSLLIQFIVYITLFLIFIKDQYAVSIPITGAVILIFYIISTKVWSYKPFKWMFWIEDISGTYEGILKYKYIDSSGEEKKGELKHCKIISQNGYKLNVNSYTFKPNNTSSSKSKNLGMFAVMQEDGILKLVYNYLNEGSTEQGFPQHYGTEIVEVIKQDGAIKLSGIYFTNRIPQTKGDFFLEKKSNDSNHHPF